MRQIIDRLEDLYDEGKQAWQRSKLPRKKANRKSTPNPVRAVLEALGDKAPDAPKTIDVTSTEMVEREGEPAYLQVCFAAIDRLKKLLHLEELNYPPQAGRRRPLATSPPSAMRWPRCLPPTPPMCPTTNLPRRGSPPPPPPGPPPRYARMTRPFWDEWGYAW